MSDIALSAAHEAAIEAAPFAYPDEIVMKIVDAAAPLIEAAVREQIQAAIEQRMDDDRAQGSTDFSEGLWSGLNEAKHIAGGAS